MMTLRLVPAKTNVRFIDWRKPAMFLSAVAVVVSIVLSFAPGLNFGIDFRGGILIEIRTPGVADLAQMRSDLGGLGLGGIELQEFGADTDVLIRIERQPGDAGAQQEAVKKVQAKLSETIGEGIDYRRPIKCLEFCSQVLEIGR